MQSGLKSTEERYRKMKRVRELEREGESRKESERAEIESERASEGEHVHTPDRVYSHVTENSDSVDSDTLHSHTLKLSCPPLISDDHRRRNTV